MGSKEARKIKDRQFSIIMGEELQVADPHGPIILIVNILLIK